MFVYKITNDVTGKMYVGITIRPLRVRFSQHRHASLAPKTPLHRAMKKYGADNFRIEMLGEASCMEELLMLEKQFIFDLRTHVRAGCGYNVSLGGHGAFGVKRSIKTKAKLSAIFTGRRLSIETRLKMSAECKTRIRSPEQIERFVRQTQTPEVRAKRQIACKGRVISTETKNKLSVALKLHGIPRVAVEKSAQIAHEKMLRVCGPDHRIEINAYRDPMGRLHCRACNLRHQNKCKTERMNALLRARIAA